MSAITHFWERVVAFGFRLLYNEFAFAYDLVSWIVSMGAWKEWVHASLQFLPQNPSDPILEIAHGTGTLQLEFARRGTFSIGYDLSPHMGRITARKLRDHGRNVRLTRGKAQCLPFRDAQFAAIVCTFPSDFILQPETLRECWRVLHAGGMLVIVPSAGFTSGGVLRSALEWLYRITGQTTDPPESPQQMIAPLFAPYGFIVETHAVPCKRSVALVIVAQKHEIHPSATAQISI
jgi:ubiquinone/menaquinone biosynthesis C-methylase UbiE